MAHEKPEREAAARQVGSVAASFGAEPSTPSVDGVPLPGSEAPRGDWRLAVVGGLAVLVGLFAASRYNYLLFHSLAELFSIVVACSIFLIVWNARRFVANSYLSFLGVAYLFVAGLDLVHTLAYKGMGIFGGGGSDLATQLWVAARAVESLSLLCATLFIGRALRLRWLLAGYAIVFVALLLSIFAWGVFPMCYVEGQGLTAFKKVSEYVVCLVLLAAIVQLWRHRASFDRGVLRLVLLAIAITIVEELAFTLYVDVYGLMNLVGHYLKLVSFYLVYRALVHTVLVNPYSLLFRELRQALGRVERSNTELEQFARVASHDLQAPLALVTDYLRLLERTSHDQLDPDAANYIAGAQEGVRRMRELIRDVLAYAHVDTSDTPFAPVDCSAAIDEVLLTLHTTIDDSGGTVTRDPLPVVLADERQIVQLLQNLIGNALKFCGDHPPHVHVGAEREGRQWHFTVRDNGIGIPPDARDQIFDMFHRLHGKSEFPGTGIGLPICKKIVERHGGRIWVESQPPNGSTFHFTIPVKES